MESQTTKLLESIKDIVALQQALSNPSNRFSFYQAIGVTGWPSLAGYPRGLWLTNFPTTDDENKAQM